MDFQERDVELLVHITAPTTAVSDDDHRALARAYMGFVPWRTTKLSEPEDIGIASSVDVVEDSFVGQPSKQGSFIQIPPVEFTTPDDRAPYRGRDGAGLGPNSDTILEGHTGKGLDGSSDGNAVPASQAEQHDSIIGEVADSYPHASVSMDSFVSPTRILEHHLRRIRSSGRPKRLFEDEAGQDQADGSGIPQKAARTQTLEALQFPLPSLRSHEPGSSPPRAVHPTVASTSSPICDSPLAVGSPNEIALASTGPMASTRNGNLGDTTKGSALPKSNLRRHQSDQGTSTTTNPAVPPLTRSTSAPSAAPSPANLASYKKKFSALEVFPPQPAVSVDHLSGSSLLTPRLQDLAEIMPLEQVYRPKFHPSTGEGTSKESDLRPLQRGYWLLDLSSWDEPSRWTTWARLHKCISGGGTGWGVWSCRDEPCVRIRMYCFASLAGHVYLLLNDASGGKLRGTEVKWIGDEGRPRITVPATEGV